MSDVSTVREALVLTRGYLVDGHGAYDLVDRVPYALDALARLEAELVRLRRVEEAARRQAHLNNNGRGLPPSGVHKLEECFLCAALDASVPVTEGEA